MKPMKKPMNVMKTVILALLLKSQVFAAATDARVDIGSIVPVIRRLDNSGRFPSCALLKKRIVYRSMRSSELNELRAKLNRTGHLPSGVERAELKALVERSLTDLVRFEMDWQKLTATWDLSRVDAATLEVLEGSLPVLPKAYVGPALDWVDPNGVLPEELTLSYDNTEKTLTLQSELSVVEQCLLDNAFTLELRLPSNETLSFRGKWSFQ